MKAFVTWLMVFGLFVSPALAETDRKAKKDAPVSKTPEKNAPASKPGEPAKADPAASPSPGLEAELQQLRDLLQAQTQELEAQRATLRQQQEKMDALETELRESHTGANTAAAPVAPADAKKIDAVVQNQEELGEKVGKIETDLANTKKSLEAGIKKIGPFNYSGDLRLRAEPFFGGPTNQSLDRFRDRFRLRFNVTAKLNEEISGGFSLASGDLNNPVSTNQTADQFYTRKPIAIDRAFINYQPKWFHELTLTGGKFAYTWYRTELTWDNDLNPEGVSQALAFNIASPVLKKITLVGFELPFTQVAGKAVTNKSFVNSAVYGGQLQTNWRFGDRIKFGAHAAFYNYHNADPIAQAVTTAGGASPLLGLLKLAGGTVANSIGVSTANGAQFASKFALLDAVARFDIDTGRQKWPLVVLGDFVQNTRACENLSAIPTGATFNAPCDPRQRRGYWLESRLGRQQEKGDWQVAYTRMFIEREAVMGTFNFDDMRQTSNVTQHRVEVFYRAYKNINMNFTGLFGRPLVTASSPLEPYLKRLQFDLVYSF